jgi:hypothetical protein
MPNKPEYMPFVPLSEEWWPAGPWIASAVDLMFVAFVEAVNSEWAYIEFGGDCLGGKTSGKRATIFLACEANDVV